MQHGRYYTFFFENIVDPDKLASGEAMRDQDSHCFPRLLKIDAECKWNKRIQKEKIYQYFLLYFQGSKDGKYLVG